MSNHAADSTTTCDAVIIGAGVVGCSVALALSRAGLSTINVEALAAPGSGSTSYSSAVVRPYYSYLEGAALAHAARGRWLDWQGFLAAGADEDLARYRECGMLILAPPDGAAGMAANRAILDTLGVTSELLDRAALRARWPDLSLDSYAPPRRPGDPDFGATNAPALDHGLFVHEAGFVNDPQLAARNLCDAARRAGARFMFKAKVAAVDRAGGRVTGVGLEDGRRVAAPVVVNAAGPHSARVNALAGVRSPVPTRPMRHEIAVVEGPDAFASGGTVIGDADTGVYFRPDTGRDVLIGSLDPACDPPDWADPDDYNAELTDQWTAQVWRTALRLPALAIPNRARGVVGLYDCTPDWIPVYDRSDLDGFYLAIGTSGNQFKNAPVIGDVMAALITACEDGRDHDADPVQLQLAAIGRTISLAVYSRRRGAGAPTSGSVLA